MTELFRPRTLCRDLGEAALWNALVALEGRPLPAGRPGATLAFRLCEPPAADVWLAHVAATAEGLPLFVEVTEFPFRALFDVDLTVRDLAELPEGLRGAIVEGMRATIAGALDPELGSTVVLVEEGLAASLPIGSAGDMQWFEVELSGPADGAVRLRLGAERARLLRHLEDRLPEPLSPGDPLAGELQVPVDATLGAITVRLRDLAAIEPGAVVVLPEGTGEEMRLRVLDGLYIFDRVEGGWRSSGPRPTGRYQPTATLHRKEPSDMSPSNEPASGDDEAGTALVDPSAPGPAAELSLAELKLAIDFDLGRAMLPLATVASWQAGTVVDLPAPAMSEGVSVVIRANGDVVGQGDLVRIDERIGVRITSFSLRP